MKTCNKCGHYYWVHSSNRFCRCQGWWPYNQKEITTSEGYEWTADVFAECICHETVDSVQGK